MAARPDNWKRRRQERLERERSTYVTYATFYRWVRRATAGFAALLVGVGVNSKLDRDRANDSRAALVKSGRIVSVDGCNRDFKLYQSIRQVFQRSLAALSAQHDNGLITDAEFARSKAFYEQQLEQFNPPDCRVTRSLLTDDPERAEQPVPRPLYPGSPEANVLVFDPKPNGG